MYKKKLQRLGAVCLAAAMVFTTFSFPGVVKAEEASAVVTANEEAGTILMQVKPSVLQANAICNTQQKPQQGKDGLASWAFDEENHWWHTRYTGTKESGEDTISATTRPWIGSGFGQEIRLKKITYKGRTDKPENNHNNIIKYSLYYADMEEPTATPTSSDWVLAKTGYFTSAVEAQDIVLGEAVKATHFKLVAENTNNWANNDTAANGYHGAGSNGGGDTSAENIKVYAEDTLNLTVKAPMNGETLTEATVNNKVEIKDLSSNPIDVSALTLNEDGTFSGAVTATDDSKLDALSGSTPFIIRAKVKLNSTATKNNVIINRGSERYQLSYGVDGSGTDAHSRIKFQMRNPSNVNSWYETKVCVDNKVGQEVEIVALYTGSKMGLWVDGARCSDYTGTWHSGQYQGPASICGSAQKLQIGQSDSEADIRYVKIIYGISSALSDYREEGAVVALPTSVKNALSADCLLDVRCKAGYSVSTKWTDGQETTVTTAEDTEGKQNYTAVVTINSVGSLQFDAKNLPTTLNVNIDGTNTVNNLPVTSSQLNSDGSITVKYAFEDMFKGGSLRLDAGDGRAKTNMRFGYSVGVARDKFVKSSWYYGTSADNLKWSLLDGTKSAVVDGDFVSNIVFKNLPSSAYSEKVYARAIVTYKDDNGVVRSKMGAFIDSRSAVDVAKKVKEAYANNTNSEAYKHASNVLTAAGITEE